ncbi:MAG: ATP-binding protein [Gemmatimonadales bacterium]
MAGYTDGELESLLRAGESDLAERKESWAGDAPTKGREAVCGFANDLPNHRKPGVLFVGVRDDGMPCGLPITDQLLQPLSDLKTDGNILPLPSLLVERRSLFGVDVAVVTVLPADSPPVRFKGRIHVRVGPRRAVATPQDERILNERRRHRNRPFDVQPVPSARLSDLNRQTFEGEYLPAAVAPDILAANDRSFEERLAASKMTLSADEPTPTVLGILIAGNRTTDFIPGGYVQFLRIAGTTLADPIVDEAEISGTLSEVIRRIDEKMSAHNRTAVDLTSGPTERRTADYPEVALQQFVRNAVMHRTYEATNNPVRITWYDDRIEISSPGGPFGTVTAETFGRPGVTDYRNPNLAEALRVLGFVQRFGVGIATARRELERNGNPPVEFVIEANYVSVTVRRR